MKPTIGRNVHYVLSSSDGVHDGKGPYASAEGKIVPAIVTAVWGETCVNLIVFLDGSNHGYDKQRHPDKPGGFEHVAAVNRWVTSATLDERSSPAPRTWHWPPREEFPAVIKNEAGEITHLRGPATVAQNNPPPANKEGPTEVYREIPFRLGRPCVITVTEPVAEKLHPQDPHVAAEQEELNGKANDGPAESASEE